MLLQDVTKWIMAIQAVVSSCITIPIDGIKYCQYSQYFPQRIFCVYNTHRMRGPCILTYIYPKHQSFHVDEYTSSTVDERPPAPVEVGSSYHCLPGFIHPRLRDSLQNQATRASNAFGLLPTHLGRCHPEFKKNMASMKKPSELVVSTHLKNMLVKLDHFPW